jgi:hypothetical protein
VAGAAAGGRYAPLNPGKLDNFPIVGVDKRRDVKTMEPVSRPATNREKAMFASSMSVRNETRHYKACRSGPCVVLEGFANSVTLVAEITLSWGEDEAEMVLHELARAMGYDLFVSAVRPEPRSRECPGCGQEAGTADGGCGISVGGDRWCKPCWAIAEAELNQRS